MSVDTSMQSLVVNGYTPGAAGVYPVVCPQHLSSSEALFRMLFETKPLRKTGPPVDTAIALDLASLFVDVQPSLIKEVTPHCAAERCC